MTKHKKYRNRASIDGQPTKLYQCWRNMCRKCTVPSSLSYKHFGGRGINVDPKWADDFDNFADFAVRMGYKGGMALILKDEDGNFEPGNIEFVDKGQAMRRKYELGHKVSVGRQRKPVVKASTGEVFSSIREAAAETGGFENELSRAIREKKKYSGSYWFPLDKGPVEEQIADFDAKREASSPASRARAVCNCNTGEMFASVQAAARSVGVSGPAIASAINRKGKAAGVCWKYIPRKEFALLS